MASTQVGIILKAQVRIHTVFLAHRHSRPSVAPGAGPGARFLRAIGAGTGGSGGAGNGVSRAHIPGPLLGISNAPELADRHLGGL